jgi:hypothetical protein
MMIAVSQWINTTFDGVERFWHGSQARRWVMWLLVGSFSTTILLVEMQRTGLLAWLLPEHWNASLARVLPGNHFYAVSVVFTILLMLEIASLALSIAGSVANALGKQFEILSLILLRQAFKEFVYFNEPIEWSSIQIPVLHMFSDAAGGLALFFAVWVYYRIQPHRALTNDPEERYRFITAKKAVSLVLLLTFAALGVATAWNSVFGAHPSSEAVPITSLGLAEHRATSGFFDAFYTILIFSDILLVLISLRYSSHYPIVFRNSGFALATVFIRLALTAPPYINVAVALGAMLFAIGLSLSYRTFLHSAEVKI